MATRTIHGQVVFTRYIRPTGKLYAFGNLVLKHGGDTYSLWTGNKALAMNADSFLQNQGTATVEFDPMTGEFFSVR